MHQNRCQLNVAVILSACRSEAVIKQLAPALFEACPTFGSFRGRQPEDFYPNLRKIPGFPRKAEYLIAIAELLESDEHLSPYLDPLIQMPGIGRKSVHVIRCESGLPVEGLNTDLDLFRVSPRIGIACEDNPVVIEAHLLQTVPKNNGMPARPCPFMDGKSAGFKTRTMIDV